MADFDAIGYAPFGFNRRDGQDDLLESQSELAKNFRLFSAAAPRLYELRRRSSVESRLVQAAVEEDLLTNRLLRFERWDALVQFGDVRRSYGGEYPGGTPDRTGRVAVLHTGTNEFLVIGVDATVHFRPADRNTSAQFLRVEEGTFTDGRWQPGRPLNGDQIFFGLRLPSAGGMLRVELIAGAGGGKHP